MKIVVINYSGNVGKTTVAAHLLKPRLNNARLFSIESINQDASADGVSVEQMRGKRYGELRKELLELDSAVIDIGASNVEDFLGLMDQYVNSHEDFDMFVVPVVKEKKQQTDTVRTIQTLSAMGIPAEKIRVVFNKLDRTDSPREDFPYIFGLASVDNSFTVNADAVIHENEVFDGIKEVQRSIDDLLNDPTDYRAQLKSLTDPAERTLCIQLMGLKMLAQSASKDMDRAFAALTA